VHHTDTTQFRWIADPAGEFTRALDLEFDSEPIFGNKRSKRYALLVEGGKVTKAAVEPDNTGIAGKFSFG
jgi:peroxiredoxin